MNAGAPSSDQPNNPLIKPIAILIGAKIMSVSLPNKPSAALSSSPKENRSVTALTASFKPRNSFAIILLNSVVKLKSFNISASLSNPIFFSSQAIPSLIRSSGIVTTELKNPVTAFSRPPQISPFANDSQLSLAAPIEPIIRVSGQNNLPASLPNLTMLTLAAPNAAFTETKANNHFPMSLAIVMIDCPVPFVKPLAITLSTQLPLSFDFFPAFLGVSSVDGADKEAATIRAAFCSFIISLKDMIAPVR